jgi:hypothetical protein
MKCQITLLPNAIERTRFELRRHVHRATERYLAAGRKAESFAEVPDLQRKLLHRVK